MKKIIALAIAMPLLATPTVSAAGEGWTGFYLGANLGRSNLDASVSGVPVTLSFDATTYGLQGGYNYEFSNKFIAGAELSYSTGTFRGNGIKPGDINTTRLLFKGGYDLGPAMVYANAGFARMSDNSDSGNGSSFGFGANYKVTDNVIAGVDFHRDSTTVSGLNLDVNTFALTLGYKF